MNYTETLESFKSESNTESILPLMDDSRLRRAVLVWPQVGISTYLHSLSPNEIPEETSERDRWNWLWSVASIDTHDFSEKCGIKLQEAQGIIEQLKALKLIFPDGTVSKVATIYMRSSANIELQKLTLKQKKST